MNEEESDIKFKVQEEILPAHKKVLINKSRFFAGLFKSKRLFNLSKLIFVSLGGMAETKQDVIEIKDCDFVVFRGHFLYNFLIP